MSQTEPLKSIAMPPAFTLESLDPDRPQNKYKIFSVIGKAREKRLRTAMGIIAQRSLKDANQVVTSIQVERWLYEFSKGNADIEIIVLSFFIEQPMNAASIEDLYNNDKLTEEFIDKVSGNFTMSSTMLQLIEYQMQITVLEAKISALEEQIANSASRSNKTSLATGKKKGRTSGTNKANEVSLPESNEAE